MSGGKGGGGGFPNEATSLADPIVYYKARTGVYPPNSISWWAYKRPIEVGSDEPPRYYMEVFDPGMRHQVTTGNMIAAQGHYIYPAFQIDRSGVSGVNGLPIETSGAARPTAVAFFAGRVWYAGVKSSKFSSRIYYSQIIERDNQVGLCYQANDPTNEDVPDILPTDGGNMTIPEVAEVHALFAKGNTLFVLASNGVWAISGSEGLGFKPTDYSVAKIDDTPVLSASSIVNVGGSPIWWNRSGIYTIFSKSSLEHEVKSLSDMTIKTFFQDIPAESKRWAQGAYNFQTKEVQWVYSSTAPASPDQYNTYDRILVYNALTNGFSPWTVYKDDAVFVSGIIASEGDATFETEEVMQIGSDVVMIGIDEVHINIPHTVAVDSRFKYLVQSLEAVGTLEETE